MQRWGWLWVWLEILMPPWTSKWIVASGQTLHPYGKPCRCKKNTFFNSASAVSLALGNLGMGMKWIILENISTTVSTMVVPSEWGSPAMKSKVMSDQGHWGTSRGWSRPASEWEDDLFLEQMGQATTYSPMSFSMADHQNHCLMKNMVQETLCWRGGGLGLG